MIPYNTRKVHRDMLEREEIRSGKINPKHADTSWAQTLQSSSALMKAVRTEIDKTRKRNLFNGVFLHRLLFKATHAYRGGGVALFKEVNGEPCVLLGLRRFNPGEGQWSFPGGGADNKETLGKAAFRELREELGVSLHKTDSRIVGRYEIKLLHFKWKTVLVETTIPVLGLIGRGSKKQEVLYKKFRNYQFGEFSQLEWVPLAKVTNRKLHFGVLGALEVYNNLEENSQHE